MAFLVPNFILKDASLSSMPILHAAEARRTARLHTEPTPEGENQVRLKTVWCSREDSNNMIKMPQHLSFHYRA